MLSSKKEKTQNVEQFIRAGRTQELLEKEHNLAEVLVASEVTGKQSDNTFANYIVEEVGKKLFFAPIDHERAINPTSFLNSGESKFPITAKELLRPIQDQYKPSEDNHSGLAGDDRAKQFIDAAEKTIKPEDIYSAYRKFADTDTDAFYNKCDTLAQNSTLLSANTCFRYKTYFDKISKNADVVSSKMNIKNN